MNSSLQRAADMDNASIITGIFENDGKLTAVNLEDHER